MPRHESVVSKSQSIQLGLQSRGYAYRATGTSIATISASLLRLVILKTSSFVIFLGSGTYRPNLSKTIFRFFGLTLVYDPWRMDGSMYA